MPGHHWRAKKSGEWPHETPSLADIEAAGLNFNHNSDQFPDDIVRCRCCNSTFMNWTIWDKPLETHLKRSPHCVEVNKRSLIQNGIKPLELFKEELDEAKQAAQLKAKSEAERAAKLEVDLAAARACILHLTEAAKQEAAKQETAIATSTPAAEPIAESVDSQKTATPAEPAKPIPTARDVGFLDPTLASNIEDFCLYNNAVDFTQRLKECQDRYSESDLVGLLPSCLRGSALAWYKAQPNINTLNSFKKALAAAFPAKQTSSTPASSTSLNPLSPSPPTSPLYHACQVCSAEFSSPLRLLDHTKQGTCSKVTCKACEASYNSNNQLHEHVRQQHQALGQRLDKTGGKCSIKSNLPTPPATPKKQSFSPNLASRPASIASEPIPKKATSLPPTPPPTPPQTSICKQVASPPCSPPQKAYLTVDDLYRMFAGRTSKIRLLRGQIGKTSQPTFGSSSPSTSRALRVSSPRVSSTSTPIQTRITSYFSPIDLPAAKSPNNEVFASVHGSAKLPGRSSHADIAPCPPTALAAKSTNIAITQAVHGSERLPARSSHA